MSDPIAMFGSQPDAVLSKNQFAPQKFGYTYIYTHFENKSHASNALKA